MNGKLNTFKKPLMSIRESARRLVSVLETIPTERFRHLVSFKDVQLSRFRKVAQVNVLPKASAQDDNMSLEQIKDIITRTSGPLGIKKDLLAKLKNSDTTEIFTEPLIESQIVALTKLLDNKYRDHYKVGEKLRKPAGNPQYYDRLMGEITGQSKENIWSALRTIFTGK